MIWEFLKPTNYDPLFIPYASYINMELYKDQKCKHANTDNSDDCFSIMFLMNGN